MQYCQLGRRGSRVSGYFYGSWLVFGQHIYGVPPQKCLDVSCTFFDDAKGPPSAIKVSGLVNRKFSNYKEATAILFTFC